MNPPPPLRGGELCSGRDLSVPLLGGVQGWVVHGKYLWECLKYVELNRVRCGVVGLPRPWEWSGDAKLMGGRKRNQLWDVAKLLWLVRATTIEEFRAHFKAALDEAIIHDELKRQEKGTAAVAVGSRGFVEAIERRIRTRQRMEAQPESGTWTLREDYRSPFEGQNASIGRFWL